MVYLPPYSSRVDERADKDAILTLWTFVVLASLVLTRLGLFLAAPLASSSGGTQLLSVSMLSSLASCFGHFDAACLTTFDIIAVDNKAGVSGWSDETQGS